MSTGGGGGKALSWMEAHAMTSTRTSSMGGAPSLLAMNGQGYTVLHVHNESSARVSAKAGLWTLDWTMDWTLDWNMDSILDSFSSS